MDLINLFRRLVVLQVLLGIVALGMAEQSPVLLLFVGAVACLSWYVTEGPSGRLLPQWLTLLGALMAVVWLPVELMRHRGHLAVPIAHFVMWLQILLLYSDKTNREYAQILVLSLLQLIVATIISQTGPTLVFAVLLLAYCMVGLFTLLSFHIKITRDAVHETNCSAAPTDVPVKHPEPVVGRDHRWQFRGTAVALAAGCAAAAIVVFILTPRREPHLITEELIGLLVHRRPGFSPNLNLRDAPSRGHDPEPVMSLTLAGEDFTEYGTDRLLRGAALDRYDAQHHTWTRSTGGTACDQIFGLPVTGHRLVKLEPSIDVRRARITVFETVDQRLFAFLSVSYLKCPTLKNLVVNVADELIDTTGPLELPLTYEIEAPIRQRATSHYELRSHRPLLRQSHTVIPANYAMGWSLQTERIGHLARGVLKGADLHRAANSPPTASDEQAVAVLADYLRRNYHYALLQHVITPDQDPIAAFLFQHRSGHCELFASALTAMARSIGMRARVVTGYRVSEYNAVGGYYIVRRRNAHAWTEVDCGPSGWRSVDATPPRTVAAEHAAGYGMFGTLHDFYEHLEFVWTRSVVWFNEQKRASIISRLDDSLQKLTHYRAWGGNFVAWCRQMAGSWRSNRVVLIFIAAMIPFILLGLVMLTRILVTRRRRLVALQLTCLPHHKRRLLVRHLRFYLIMLDRLERHGFVRPIWMSPFGFAQQLAAEDQDRFAPVVALTELFYEVRFGYRALDDDRRRLIRSYLQDLELMFAPKNP